MILTQGLPTAKNADMSSNIRWRRAVERFLAAVDASQRRNLGEMPAPLSAIRFPLPESASGKLRQLKPEIADARFGSKQVRLARGVH